MNPDHFCFPWLLEKVKRYEKNTIAGLNLSTEHICCLTTRPSDGGGLRFNPDRPGVSSESTLSGLLILPIARPTTTAGRSSSVLRAEAVVAPEVVPGERAA